MKMNILYILRHNPWGIGGGCYASKCYLDAFTTVFANAHFDVCLCAEYLTTKHIDKDYPNVSFVKVAERKTSEKLLSPLSGLLHRFDRMARKMLKTGKYDYCVFDHNSIAGPLVKLCRQQNVKTIVINHNCEAEYYRGNHGLMERLFFLHHVKRVEKDSYIGCNYNIFLTAEDCYLFKLRYGNSETRSVVTGCFDPKGKENDTSIKKKGNNNRKLTLIISGTIGNVQNMDGIQFFLSELLPAVPATAEVIIAGKNPPPELFDQIEKLNQTSKFATIRLIPNPNDMMELVCNGDIFVCPTRLGGGLKLRVMDGLKAGLPVIAHKVSARGYSEFIHKGMLWSFEDKDSFTDALNSAIAKVNIGMTWREEAWEFARMKFSFEDKVQMLSFIFT